MSISQSGLSASIRALERELQAALFVRNTRSVELTEAGRALLCEGRRTLAAAEAAKDAVAAVQGLIRGHLTVGLEQCLGVVDVPALLAKFRSARSRPPVIQDHAVFDPQHFLYFVPEPHQHGPVKALPDTALTPLRAILHHIDRPGGG
jgi:DNA-binding transcriptional LysR family regulator